MDQYRLPVMVMEKMQHSLRGLVEYYDNIPLNVKLSILDEVCLGLRYLHSRNPPIVHRDLTPNQDTRSCVSGQESRVTHKCVIYIKTHGRVSAAKKAV